MSFRRQYLLHILAKKQLSPLRCTRCLAACLLISQSCTLNEASSQSTTFVTIGYAIDCAPAKAGDASVWSSCFHSNLHLLSTSHCMHCDGLADSTFSFVKLNMRETRHLKQGSCDNEFYTVQVSAVELEVRTFGASSIFWS